MRAHELRTYDGPDGLALVECPAPNADDDHAVVEVSAIGVNFPDLLMTKGQYQLKPELPIVPGCEIAGVIRDAGPGSSWRVGDRVAAFIWSGGYAEQVRVPVASLVAVPDGVDLSAAAAMLVNYHTALFALQRRGQVRDGDSVLVMGAAGGVGTAAVQVARGLGARVIAGVSSEARAETATAAGADDVLVLTDGFSKQVRELTDGRGVDAVLDPVGDWLFDEALRALAPEGRILIVGFAAGSIPELRVNRLLLRNVSAVGVAWGAFLGIDGELLASQAAHLDEMVAAGFVRPHIGATFPFEDVPRALTALATGRIPGKGVVLVEH